MAGVLERVFTPRMLRRLYEDELSNLEQVAKSVQADIETGAVAR